MNGRVAATTWALGALLVVAAAGSLFVGVSALTPVDLLRGDDEAWRLLWTSRLPRLAALVLAGSALGVAGLIMQGLTRNRFVAPSTAGTIESASLGALVAIMVFGGTSVLGKMLVAVAFACVGTGAFMALAHRLRGHDAVVVPLVGIMFGAVVSSFTTWIAFRAELLQSLNTLGSGNFATVLRGRYEPLWAVAVLTLVAYRYADRFTVAGMGREISVNLGIPHERVVIVGLGIAASVTAVVVVVVGAIPFLGLVVPNLVTSIVGDRLRRVVPLTAIGGALLVLLCDVVGRVVRAPYEIPVGTVAGVAGGLVFLVIATRGRVRVA